MNADLRHKNADWILPPSDAKGNVTDSTVTNAVLMDIRDELRRLNALLHCPNFVSIPKKLDAIQRKLPPRRKRVKLNARR